ncbi:MAG: Ornithine decarboxylase [Sarcosagium campestre]|nr:MAG: Ornithine decarboxylase [Sarcosagium campestre]
MAPSAIDTFSTSVNDSWTRPGTNIYGKAAGYKQPVQNGAFRSRQLIAEALKERSSSVDHEDCDPGDEDAFFVADMGEVYRQHLRWKLSLPRVKPFYAVKCNPDPEVLRLLSGLGTGFDCASKQEVEQVLKMGVDSSRIIYANPCKTTSHVRFAAKQGVNQMTFDNADELNKIKRHHPSAELYLRILTDDSSSLCRLSLKFGASLDATQGLLNLAKELDLNVVGVSFHVGSGATDPGAFRKAVADARSVFDQASDVGYNLHTLDVGGGFSSDTFDSMASVLSDALDEYFPPHIRIIGEPGRYYVARAFTIACNVIARRTIGDPSADNADCMLYLNDGLYGNFSSIMFDHQNPVPLVLRAGGRFLFGERGQGNGRTRPTQYSIWGPTCDGIDRIASSCAFSEKLDVGDWLYFEDMGAYTKCSATRFNGFNNDHEVVYISSEPGASALLGMD